MGEYKNAAEHMIVIVVPDVLVGKGDYWFFVYHIDDLKTFQFQISDSQELIVEAERLAVTGNSVVYSVVELGWFVFYSGGVLLVEVEGINLDQLLLLVLNHYKSV